MPEDPMPPEPPLTSSDLGFDDFTAEFNNIPIPNMDLLFSDTAATALPNESFADLDFTIGFDDNDNIEFTFDDFDSVIPSDAEDFLLPEAHNPNGSFIPPLIDGHVDVSHSQSPESGNSTVSGGHSCNVSRFLNSEALDSVSFKKEPSPVVAVVSGNQDSQESQNSIEVKVSSLRSPESEDESSHGPVSSQGSGNGGSGVYEAMNSPSPDSDRYRDISSSQGHANVEKDVKLEGIGKGCDLKRKKEQSDGSAETRSTKYRRSSAPVESKTLQQCESDVNANGGSGGDDEDEKRKARLMRNRESAQLSRQRKKHYVEELEEKVKAMNSTIADLSSKITFVMAENATLRQQLGGGGGMYPPHPMAPMPYPWVPCAPYVVKPQGSQVPLVPIPRLRPQQPAAAPKSKKSEGKKSEVRTKKVASISLLGLFFFIMLFGGFVPMVDVKFGGLVNNLTSRSSYVSDKWVNGGQGGGKVWPVNGVHMNGSGRDEDVGLSYGRFSISDRRDHERLRKLEESHERHDPRSDESVRPGSNASEPLVASLYVPRNDKLVKIDGNLIIHSIMASEKAMASKTVDRVKEEKNETGLAIPNSALAIPEAGRNRGQHPHVYRVSSEQRKAIGSGSTKTLKDHMKSTATDGKMQQWFQEGLAGPMLSSGMCTEVFQFDVSPTPGAIVPATSVANISAADSQNATTLNKSKNRRILHGLPDPLPGSKLNLTEDHVRNSLNNSSMVVSVLVDPKEATDVNVDGVMTPKSLSRIFVVVLMDSVKYVTYSCGLPRASPHLVAA